jgi:hypothetical protein
MQNGQKTMMSKHRPKSTETLVNSHGIRGVMPHAILGLLLDLAIDVSGCVTRNPVDGCRYHFKSLIRA